MATTDADVESLQEERAFLLRSLADLDAEYEAGDIDDDDYRSLTNDYTARTAAVLRALEGLDRPQSASRRPRPAGPASPGRAPSAPAVAPATDPAPGPPRSRRRQTVAVLVVVLGFGAAAAWLVAQSSGTRLPGQTVSGNSQLTPTPPAATGGVDQRLVDAANDVNNGQVADALKLYDAVLKDDPNQPVALADGGWLEAQAGLSANRSDLVDTGLVKIEKAEKIDPSFADAHFFRGFLLLRAKNDAPGAVTELRLYLSTVDPAAPQVASVQQLLDEAIKTAGPNVPIGPKVATTTSTRPP
jgi:tetratricopeptide (TPR) repeat protein